MGFNFRLTDLALDDLDRIVAATLRETSTAVAARWLDGLERAVLSLTEGPQRDALAPESDDLEFETRQIPYQAHRILYMVEKGTVGVLRIYSGVQQRLTMNLLQSP